MMLFSVTILSLIIYFLIRSLLYKRVFLKSGLNKKGKEVYQMLLKQYSKKENLEDVEIFGYGVDYGVNLFLLSYCISVVLITIFLLII